MTKHFSLNTKSLVINLKMVEKITLKRYVKQFVNLNYFIKIIVTTSIQYKLLTFESCIPLPSLNKLGNEKGNNAKQRET